MLLESGPAKGDRNYFAIVSVALFALTAYFWYDGLIGWVAKNRKNAREFLPGLVGAQPLPEKFGEVPTDKMFDALKTKGPLAPADIRAAWGEPFHVARKANDVIEVYVSDYGYAEVPSRLDRVSWADARWHNWYKPKDEITRQFYWSIVPGVFGLYFLYRLYRALTLRVTVDEQGMQYAGQAIPFASMVSLRDYSPKGWVDLYYRPAADGPQRKLRLDNQRVAKFDEIIEVICMKKGFEDPRRSDLDDVEDPDDSAEDADDSAHR